MRVHKAGDHANRLVYRCQETGKVHVSVPVAPMDDLVERVVVEKLSRPDAADLIAAPVKGVNVAALRAELATCRDRLDEIAADYEDDKMTKRQFLTRTDKRRAKDGTDRSGRCGVRWRWWLTLRVVAAGRGQGGGVDGQQRIQAGGGDLAGGSDVVAGVEAGRAQARPDQCPRTGSSVRLRDSY